VDSKTVEDKLHFTNDNGSEVSCIIKAYSYIFIMCPNFSWSFLKKQANNVVHFLVRATLS